MVRICPIKISLANKCRKKNSEYQKVVVHYYLALCLVVSQLMKLLQPMKYRHQTDFPSEDLLSSLSYNEEKLVNFIADSLKLDYDVVKLPQIKTRSYRKMFY